jgi:N-methylhydantoinase A
MSADTKQTLMRRQTLMRKWMDVRFAVDTGGTFTDLVVERADGSIEMYKAPTTPVDPVEGVIDSLTIAAQASGEKLADYLARGVLLVHGTTHAINAIVTGATAQTAFLTTAGHPDTLVFREGGRMEPFNFTVPYPEPFIAKRHTFEVRERVMVDGSVRIPLDRPALIATLQHLKQQEIEAIAVCLLWSIVNPEHELKVGELIETYLPGVPYTLSHKINPAIREYRRASSTAIDASLKPVMGRYMRSLDTRLRQCGFVGRLLIVTSQGGVIDAVAAAEAPVNLVNSGPSMAPVAARAYGTAHNDTLIVGDAGGTTFDVSLVRRGRIPKTRETWLGEPFRSPMTGMPSVDIKSIGAGGGSIAWVDPGGLLHVGPISAGAHPGPACYGRGGERATVTDAALVLGFIDPDFFLGGRMQLNRGAAIEALERTIAARLHLSVEAAAAAVMALATEHMVQAIMSITVNQGIDPTTATFVAGGGAGGLNCVAIGQRLGTPRVLVPETGAALAAQGALISDLTAHKQAMFHADSRRFEADAVNRVLSRLEEECTSFAANSHGRSTAIHWSTEARYPDQAWEIDVALAHNRFRGDADLARLVGDFHAVHQEIFAVSDPNSAIEMVGWNAEVRCQIGSGQPGRLSAPAGKAKLPARRVRFQQEGWQEVAVHRFEMLAEGVLIDGPAIVESGFTSIVIDPDARAARDRSGTLVIELGAAANKRKSA